MRLFFLRGSGADFSERDRALLVLLRPHLHQAYVDAERRRHPVPQLTARHWDLLRLLAAGHTNAKIARRLGICDGTARTHLETIYARLNVSSRTAAVTRAFPGHTAQDPASTSRSISRTMTISTRPPSIAAISSPEPVPGDFPERRVPVILEGGHHGPAAPPGVTGTPVQLGRHRLRGIVGLAQTAVQARPELGIRPVCPRVVYDSSMTQNTATA